MEEEQYINIEDGLSVGYIGGFDEELYGRVDNIEDEIEEIKKEQEELHERVDVIEGEIDEIKNEQEELFQCVSNAKKNLAEAITDKGVETSATDTFQTMVNNINKINTNNNDNSRFHTLGFEYVGNISGLSVLSIYEFINDMSGEEM